MNARPQPEPTYEPDSTNNAVSSTGHAREVTQGAASPEATLVADGPLFSDFTASVNVEWKSGRDSQESGAAAGLVFRLHNRGYYAVILSRDALKSHLLAFKLLKKLHAEPIARDVLPWTELPRTNQFLGKNQQKISVQCRGPVIQILFQDTLVAKVEDDDFKEGMVGMILGGLGRATFRDLVAEEVRPQR